MLEFQRLIITEHQTVYKIYQVSKKTILEKIIMAKYWRSVTYQLSTRIFNL